VTLRWDVLCFGGLNLSSLPAIDVHKTLHELHRSEAVWIGSNEQRRCTAIIRLLQGGVEFCRYGQLSMHKRHFACTSHPSEVLRAPATVPISSEALSIRAWASHLDCWQLGVDCVSAYQPTRDTGPSGNLQLPFGRVAARPVCTHPTAHPAAVTSAMAAARPPAAAVEAQVTSGTEPQQTTNLSFTRAMTHAAGRISWDMRASIWAMAATGPMHGATRRSVPCRPTHTPTRLVV